MQESKTKSWAEDDIPDRMEILEKHNKKKNAKKMETCEELRKEIDSGIDSMAEGNKFFKLNLKDTVKRELFNQIFFRRLAEKGYAIYGHEVVSYEGKDRTIRRYRAEDIANSSLVSIHLFPLPLNGVEENESMCIIN